MNNLKELNEVTNNELEMFLTQYNTVYVVRVGSDYEAFVSNCVSIGSEEQFIAEVKASDYFDSKSAWREAFLKYNPNENPDNYQMMGFAKESA